MPSPDPSLSTFLPRRLDCENDAWRVGSRERLDYLLHDLVPTSSVYVLDLDLLLAPLTAPEALPEWFARG